jgi:hypothetical protein
MTQLWQWFLLLKVRLKGKGSRSCKHSRDGTWLHASPPPSAHFQLFGGKKKVPLSKLNAITCLTITSKWSVAMMEIFLSLDKYPALCELKLLGASLHPDEAVFHFSSLFLWMSTSCESILDHIAEYLQFISDAQSFWFMLNTS